MDTVLGIFIGISLSAAAGFRVFVPLLVVSIAAQAELLSLAEGFEWIATTPALIAFSVATIMEIAAFYIPWLDNLLDTIATPAAVVAGIVLTASVISGMSPFLSWSLAIIAGGGIAGTVQVATSVTRIASTATTGGVANPIFATAELGGALTMSAIAVFIPIAGFIFVCLLVIWGVRKVRKRRKTAEIRGVNH